MPARSGRLRSITALATSNIDVSTGRGSVHGTFKIVVQERNTDTDGPERVVIRGRLDGQIDLSRAFEGVPLGSIEGRWSAVGEPGTVFETVRIRGTLEGVFRLPFQVVVPPVDAPVAVYLLDDLTVVPVRDDERSLSKPTVRLDVIFTERA
jgi:hypothetical protein